MDYYKIISISRSRFVSGQYGCLFSRCRKYVIHSLIHGNFHIGLAIIPRPILALDSVSGQYGGLTMITRPIWKCPCINLYVYWTIFTYEHTEDCFCGTHWLPDIYHETITKSSLLRTSLISYSFFLLTLVRTLSVN